MYPAIYCALPLKALDLMHQIYVKIYVCLVIIDKKFSIEHQGMCDPPLSPPCLFVFVSHLPLLPFALPFLLPLSPSLSPAVAPLPLPLPPPPPLPVPLPLPQRYIACTRGIP
jgi:hypothetical protein